MKVSEAISNANELRPNTLGDEIKAKWIFEVESEIAEMMEEEVENTWPQDRELLMESPYDNIYPLYLCSMIDYYNQETTIYANDKAMYESAMANCKAHYRRENNPDSSKVWKVMK